MLPQPTDRALFLGQTGCGKTTLAKYLLSKRKYVVVFDEKECCNWRGYVKTKDLNLLMRLKPSRYPKVIYQPGVEEFTKENVERFFKWCYIRRNCTVYVDEVYSAVQYGPPKYYMGCISKGRQRHIEVWNSVQRPSWIPISILSESEHFYIFRLTHVEDRKRVAGLTGIDRDAIQELPKQHYYYVPQGEPVQGIYTLNIEK